MCSSDLEPVALMYPERNKKRTLPKPLLVDIRKNKAVTKVPGFSSLPRSKSARTNKHKVPKKEAGVSTVSALAHSSSLAPNRVTLSILAENLVSTLRYFAVLTSYHIQATGAVPRFITDNEFEWNPSVIWAYYISIYTNRLSSIGAFASSNIYSINANYILPTFVAKHLQQICASSHFGREIAVDVTGTNSTVADLLAVNCGNGGIPAEGAVTAASCYVDLGSDTEGFFSNIGVAQPIITPDSLTPEILNKLSAVISRSFKNHVKIGDIPRRATSNELKIAPVTSTADGQVIYSCIDGDAMCDFILPLAGFNAPTLINSPNPLQAAAPVRVDGSLVMSPESKIAFMFWLANRHPFAKEDTFIGYLRKYGFKDKHLANIQINLRQINWTSLANMVGVYLTTLVSFSAAQYIFVYNYLVTIVWSAILPAFRSFCPINQGFTVSKQFADIMSNPGYACATRSPKIPPFVANFLEAIKRPIRAGNQITVFFGQIGEQGTLPQWVTTATNPVYNYNFANGTYGAGPLPMTSNGMGITAGPYLPYPGFVAAASTAPYTDAVRNQVTLNGIGPGTSFLQTRLISTGGAAQNIFTQWNDKSVQFTKRTGRFYIPSVVTGSRIYPSGSGAGITLYVPVPKLIASWEPVGFATSVLALAHLITYYLPFDSASPLLPVFAGNPSFGIKDATAVAVSAANPGQGSQQAIQMGKSSNPAETQGHITADALEGIIPDQSAEPPQHLKEKVKKEVTTMVSTGFEDVKKAGEGLVKDGFKAVAALI